VHLVILWLYIGLSESYWVHWAVIVASEDYKMSKQGTAGKSKHITNNSSETWNN
jgi:hypothetical protein